MAESILLIGESGAGKTHYGAQLLKRLMGDGGELRMNGAATNLEPFLATMQCLDEGMAAEHTASGTYVDSVWPIASARGRAQLIWPDYGGEQVRNIPAARRMPAAWRDRAAAAPAWALLLRLQALRQEDDLLSRPLTDLRDAGKENREVRVSDQARMVELLQMLLQVRGAPHAERPAGPRLAVLLTCWDELGADGAPGDALASRLPMFDDFVRAKWADPLVLGLSALGKPLSQHKRDPEYAARGPERFGYVVLPDGERSTDLTLPIKMLLDGRG